MAHFASFDVPLALYWNGFDPMQQWPGISPIDRELLNQELRPRDHQTLGATEIITRSYSGVETEGQLLHNRGVIVADQTSLGKTLQAVQVICGLAQMAKKWGHLNVHPSQQRSPESINAIPPVFLRSRSGLAELIAQEQGDVKAAIRRLVEFARIRAIACIASGNNPFSAQGPFTTFAHTKSPAPPCLHSIVTGPPNLIKQWRREISRYSDVLKVHWIKNVPSASRVLASLSKTQQRWQQGHQRDCPADHVVLIPTTALTSMHRDMIKRTEQKKPPRFSVYSFRYSALIFDEAHIAKSAKSHVQKAIHRLSQISAFGIALTATPVCNNAEDIAVIANTMGFPEAEHVANSDQNMLPQYIAMLRTESRLQRKMDCGATVVDGNQWYKQVSPATGQLVAFASDFLSSDTDIAGLAERLNVTLTVRTNYIKAVKDTLGISAPYLIRRTKISHDRFGRPLIALGSKTEVIVNVCLPRSEIIHITSYLRKVEDRRGEKQQAPAE